MTIPGLPKRTPIRLSCLVAVLASLATTSYASPLEPGQAAAATATVIGAGHDQEFNEVFSGPAAEAHFAPFSVQAVHLWTRTVVVSFSRPSGPELDLVLHHPDVACEPCLRIGHFSISLPSGDPDGIRLAVRLSARLEASRLGSPWQEIPVRLLPPGVESDSDPTLSALPGATLVIGSGHDEVFASAFGVGVKPSPLGPFETLSIVRQWAGVVAVLSREDGKDFRVVLRRPSVPCDHCIVAGGFSIDVPTDVAGHEALATRLGERLEAAGGVILWSTPTGEMNWTPPRPVSDTLGGFLDGLGLPRYWEKYTNTNPLPILAVWLVFFVLGAWLVIRLPPGAPRPWMLALLVGGSGALRLFLASPGPGNYDIHLFTAYGQAPAALLSAWIPLTGLTFEDVIFTSWVLGSLAPAAFALFVSEAGGTRRASLGAGVLLSIQPLLVRYSADCERQGFVILLGATALWGLALHLRTRRVAPLLLHLAASFLCLESRPEALCLVGMSTLLIWPGRPFRAAAIPALLVQVGLAMMTVWGMSEANPGSNPPGIASLITVALSGQRSCLFFDPDFTPVSVQLLCLAGCVMAVRQRWRLVSWGAASLLVVVALTMPWSTSGFTLLWARLRTLGFLPFVFLAALGLDAIEEGLRAALSPRSSRRAIVLVWLAVVASSAGTMIRVTTPSTMDLEVQFVLQTLRILPPGAEVLYPKGKTDYGFRSFPLLSKLAGRSDVTWREWPEEASDVGRQRFFYVHSLCNDGHRGPSAEDDLGESGSTPLQMEASCDAALALASGPALREASLPARRWGTEVYRSDEVRVAFVPLRPATANPAGPTTLPPREPADGTVARPAIGEPPGVRH